MTTLLTLYLLSAVATWFIAAGWDFAYYQREWPTLAEKHRERDATEAICASLALAIVLPVFGLIMVHNLTNFARHGWKFPRFTRKTPPKVGQSTKTTDTLARNCYPERELYPNEVSRTETRHQSTHCQYCGNADTSRVIRAYDLKPFVAWYKHDHFKVYSCYCCGGLWHFEIPTL